MNEPTSCCRSSTISLKNDADRMHRADSRKERSVRRLTSSYYHRRRGGERRVDGCRYQQSPCFRNTGIAADAHTRTKYFSLFSPSFRCKYIRVASARSHDARRFIGIATERRYFDVGMKRKRIKQDVLRLTRFPNYRQIFIPNRILSLQRSYFKYLFG